MSGTFSTDLQPIAIGKKISQRYEILRHIGSGGMASVFLARDELLRGTEVALKVLNKEFADDESYVSRFIQEVELMNKVNHPHVVRTFEIGRDAETIYFTMEYVKGGSLEQRIDSSLFDIRKTASLVVQICEGLQAIHRQDIVHRDLKPGNILFSLNDSVKITDFGVARPKGSRLTKKNQKVGSVCYMAPEIWLSKTPTPAADVYNLGVLLYEISTGELPFDGADPADLMTLHIKKMPEPPRVRNPETPIWLNSLIMSCLEKQIENRPDIREIIAFVTQDPDSNQKAKRSAKRNLRSTSKLTAVPKEEDGPATMTGTFRLIAIASTVSSLILAILYIAIT
jgi:serine/threonine-protein kinase